MSLKYIISIFIFLLSFAVPQKGESKIQNLNILRPVSLNYKLMKKLKKQGGILISKKVGDYILRAESLSENKRHDEAIELLEYHYNRKDQLSKLERAHLAFYLGTLFRQKDFKQKENKKKSLQYFQTALDLSALDYNKHLFVLYNTAQIYIEENRNDKGFQVLKDWFSVNENPHPSSYILLAGVYYNKKQLDNALKYLEHALSLVLKPEENWLQLVIAIHLKKKNYQKAKPYLEKLIAMYPNRASPWRQLAGVYLYLNEHKKAFVTLDMAYSMGYLKRKTGLLNLASLYIDQGLPYQSGRFLEENMKKNRIPRNQKNLELLAEAFYLSREGEKSLAYLKEASKKARSVKFFIKYGQRLLHEEKWKSAESVFKKALAFQEIKNTIKNIESYKRLLARQNQTSFESNSRRIPARDESKKSSQKLSLSKNDTDLVLDKETIASSEEKLSLKAPSTNNLEHIHLNLGIAFYNQKDYQSALNHFKRSIEIDDTFLSGYRWIDYTEASLVEQKQASLSM